MANEVVMALYRAAMVGSTKMQLMVILVLAMMATFSMRFRNADIASTEFDKNATIPIRGLLAVLVVLGHLSWRCCTSMPMFNFFHFEDFAVAGFFFLSGYGLMRKIAKELNLGKPIVYLKRAALKLFIPLTILTILWQLCLWGFGSTEVSIIRIVKDFIFNWQTPLPHTWYIWVLFLFYVMFYFAIFCMKVNRLRVLLLFALVVCWVLLARYILWAPLWWWRTSMAFPIGVWYAAFGDEILLRRVRQIRGIFLLSGSVLFCVGLFGGAAIEGLCLSLACLFLPFCIDLCACVGGLKFVGGISFEIYLLHGVYEVGFMRFCRYNPVLYLCMVFAFTVISAWIFQRIYYGVKPSLIKHSGR